MYRWVVLFLVLIVVGQIRSVGAAGEIEELTKLEEQIAALRSAGHYREALPVAQKMVSEAQRAFANQPAVIAVALTSLGHVYFDLGLTAEAEQLYSRALSIQEHVWGPDHDHVATVLNDLANVYWQQAKFPQAEAMYQRALRIWEKEHGPESLEVSDLVHNLAGLFHSEGRYADAVTNYLRSLKIREKILGTEHRAVAQSLNVLANVYSDQGRYSQAEPLYLRAMAICKKLLGPTNPAIASNFGDLAILYQRQGRYTEAEPLLRQAMTIWEQVVGPEYPMIASNLSVLGNVYQDQGRYAEAEVLYRRALEIREKAFGSEHPKVAGTLSDLGNVCWTQSRFDEAERCYLRALAINEKMLSPTHPEVAGGYVNLANLCANLGRNAEAEALYRRALPIREQVFGRESAEVAATLSNLAIACKNQGRLDEAERLHRQALAIFEKALGKENAHVGHQCLNLGCLLEEEAKFAEAMVMAKRAVDIDELAGIDRANLLRDYALRARLRWQAGNKDEAIADLSHALELVEEARGKSSGGERERAGFFERFGSTYEQMITWQRELNRPDQVLATIESSRARSLADQLAEANINLLAGLPEAEATQLRQRDSLARQRLAELEKQIEQAKDDESLAQQLRAAREEVVQAYLAVRNASPAYRQLVGRNYQPASLADVHAKLVGHNGLLLEYYLGDKTGCVVVVPPAGGKVQIEALTLDQEQAKILGVDPGPLTAQRMRTILTNDSGSGVLQQLRQPAKANAAVGSLAALWKVLIPESAQKLLTEGKLKRWIAVPDATLSAFPFETLVVEQDAEPKYLLDVAPPLVNSPSATLLLNLMDQPTGRGKGVLSVGDAIYGAPATGESRGSGAFSNLTAAARYGSLRGSLKPLPFTALESQWVAEVFKEAGVNAGRLEKQNAREASVRMYGPGNEILHLACHGLVDQSYGNLFGALALTPGPAESTDPGDDGYLTLSEIYGLNLKGMELAILSACDTNLGPEQYGEGSWSLSRGFLVAGAKRVVASNWLVDDEAAASLVSVFCGAAAKAHKTGTVDYAADLQAAKRWVRNQDKWKSPYYWGTFVLIGPN